MSNIILEFLEAYKSLDELCKQLLASDKGITEYIEGMSKESQGAKRVVGWENDYKQLKRLRWIRNQLVHDANSFQDDLVVAEDVHWLNTFRLRILECSDPYSLLYQSRNTVNTNILQSNQIKQIQKTEITVQTDGTDSNLGLVIVVTVFVACIMGLIIGMFLYNL